MFEIEPNSPPVRFGFLLIAMSAPSDNALILADKDGCVENSSANDGTSTMPNDFISDGKA